MGRKGRALAQAASALDLSELGDDNKSVSTASVCSALSYQFEDARAESFAEKVDAMLDKRGSTREKALEQLAVMLRVEFCYDDAVANNETIVSRCLVGLKRGGAVEASLAAQLLGLHLLTLGAANESLFESLRPELERSAGGGGAAVQLAAAESLALATFVLAEDEEHTRAVMERLRGMWQRGDAKARAAGVRCWAFLATTLSRRPSDTEAAAWLAGLGGLLEERDVELRSAAGEAVAVLQACFPTAVSAVLSADGDDAGGGGGDGSGDLASPGSPAGGHANGHNHSHHGAAAAAANGHSGHAAAARGNGRGARGSGGGAGVEGLLDRMHDLASNKGDSLRHSRRDRAAQRSTFRGLLASLSGGAAPSCRVKLQHGDALVVSGVARTTQLAFLRRFLAGGFQAHLQRNPLLHDVFGFTPRAERAERMSAVEKRLTRSCQSEGAKARSADRRWSRDAKVSRLGWAAE